MQVLESLAADTVGRALEASPFPLHYHLSSLPTSLSTIAVLAAYPSIRRSNTLHLNCSEVPTSTAVEVLENFLAAPINQSMPCKHVCIQQLRVRPETEGQEAVNSAGALLGAIDTAVGRCEGAVSLSDCSISCGYLQRLLCTVRQNTRLQSLKLSRVCFPGYSKPEFNLPGSPPRLPVLCALLYFNAGKFHMLAEDLEPQVELLVRCV